jgi:putative nucleotidyltransferase with HDIG domain
MALARVRQGLRALSAWARPVDDDLAATFLSPPLLALFHRMRRSEQQHSLNVLRTLRRRGYDDPVLMVAALLHDVGKCRAAYHLWDRVIVVLAKAVAPDRVRRWGSGEPTGWRRPFVVNSQHPRWSAEMVAAVGADPLVIDLIAAHQRHLDHAPQTRLEELLVVLQSADDAN